MLVKPFSYEEEYFVYDAYSNNIINVDKIFYDIISVLKDNGTNKVFESLSASYDNDNIKRILSSIDRLQRDQGVFLDLSNISFKLTDDIEDALKNRLWNLTFDITDSCNLKCKYCVYGKHYPYIRSFRNQSITEEIASKSIKHVTEHNKDTDLLCLGFYGGEPFLRFDIIKGITELFHKLKNKDKWQIHATTNLTILNNDIIDYLISNDVRLLVSLDIDKNQHNKFRIFKNGVGTYDTVLYNLRRIKRFSNEYFENRVQYSPTLAPPVDYKNVLDKLKHGALFKKKALRITYMDPNGTEYYKNVKYKQLKGKVVEKLMADFYESFKDRSSFNAGYVSFLENVFGSIQLKKVHNRQLRADDQQPDVIHPNGICIPGKNRLFVQTDGTYKTCERVYNEHFNIGHVNKGINLDHVKEIVNHYISLCEKDCKTCWAIKFCPMCYTAFNSGIEYSSETRERNCITIRNHMEKSMKLYCKMLNDDQNIFEPTRPLK